jgi:spore coat polysaccharide biosynthesis predicted glycosyltransferase SpsG
MRLLLREKASLFHGSNLVDLSNCSTTSKVSRIQEFFDVENLPDLTKEEVEAIEAAGAKLYKRAFLQHLFDQ